MFKKIALLLSSAIVFANANITNSIAIIVENEPITSLEINSAMKDLKLNKKDAQDILIQDRLEHIAIKNLDLTPNTFEINQAIDEIIKQSNLSKQEFKNSIIKKGHSYDQFKKDLSRDIGRKKLYQNIFSNLQANISEEKIKDYFQKHKKEFTTYKNINATIFVSNDENLLLKQKQSLLSLVKGVQRNNFDTSKEKIDPNLYSVLSNMKPGEFSQIFKGSDGFKLIYVNSKSGKKQAEFNEVQNQVANAFFASEQERAVKEYFERLRSKVSIKFIK